MAWNGDGAGVIALAVMGVAAVEEGGGFRGGKFVTRYSSFENKRAGANLKGPIICSGHNLPPRPQELRRIGPTPDRWQ